MKKALILIPLLLSLGLILVSCGTGADHPHSFGEWTSVSAPTCARNGERVRVCECGEEEHEVLPATGHKYEKGFVFLRKYGADYGRPDGNKMKSPGLAPDRMPAFYRARISRQGSRKPLT